MRKYMSKRNVISALALILVAALVVAGTIALYTAMDEKINTFTFTSEGIKISIIEEDWVPANAVDLKVSAASEDITLLKDPVVKNISANELGVATVMRLTWTKGDGEPLSMWDYENYIAPYVSLTDLAGANWSVEVDYSSADADPASRTYSYLNELPYNAATTELFTAVVISKSTPAAVIEKYVEWGGFQIKIEAAAVDAASFSGVVEEALSAALELLP